MSEINDKLGTCRFCGQSRVIETVGDVTQDQRDEMATELCDCPGAKSESRKKARSEKIKRWVAKTYDDESLQDLIKRLIWHLEQLYENPEAAIESVQIKETDGHVLTMNLNNDLDLCVSRKKTSKEELRF